jgi:uncharacterized phage infection (PIP) family protein YhgE
VYSSLFLVLILISLSPTHPLLSDSLGKDIDATKGELERQKEAQNEIANWIKIKLGSNLELLKSAVSEITDKEFKNFSEDTKEREEDLWRIFAKKFEAYKEDIQQERRQVEDNMNAFFISKIEEQKRIVDATVQQFEEEKRNLARERETLERERLYLQQLKQEINEDMQKMKELGKSVEEERLRIVEEEKNR